MTFNRAAPLEFQNLLSSAPFSGRIPNLPQRYLAPRNPRLSRQIPPLPGSSRIFQYQLSGHIFL
jgi:hypothetical protein